MKKILYISLIALSGMMAATSCSDFLDEKTNGKVFDTVLSSQDGLEAALTGAYRGWEACWSYGFTNGWATEMTIGGDDLTCPPGDGNTQEYDKFAVTNTNSSAPTVYQGCYKAIQGANKILEAYQSCTGDAATIKLMAGEAYFIRAASYYWLVKCFGKLPLILHSAYDAADTQMPLSSVADVYAQIESDFKAAIDILGNSRRGKQDGRPNKGAAQAMLAEVYLSEAGWPLNQTAKYAEAAAMAKNVLDNHAAYGFDFESSYSVLWENKDYGTNNNMNKEDIYTIPTNLSDGNSLNAENGYWAYPGELGGWDVVFAEYTFFQEFPEGPRKDATFAYTYMAQDSTKYTWKQLKYHHPYYAKLMKNPSETKRFYNYASQIPMRMLRYSQTALTYAEAKARSSAPDDLAYTCLNTIRKRAGLPTYSGLTKDDFIQKCLDERKWEFAGEKVRWFDMVRLGQVQSVIANRDKYSSIYGAEFNPPKHTVTEADYFFPIPNHDEYLNSNINK